MRVIIVYEETRVPFDIKPDASVKDLRKMIKTKMIVETTEDKKVGKHLEMSFGGAALQDKWTLDDIAITSGSVIKCALKTVEKPKLKIFLVYSKENVSITDDINIITMRVGELRSLLSAKLGIPVSAFRLSLAAENNLITSFSKKNDAIAPSISSQKQNNELFDSHTLDYYGVEIGSTVNLDLWDGWNELILAAIAGHEKIVAQYFSWEKPVRLFQQKVALYIASHFGHMGLAAAMIKYGAKGHEPVGIHPYRKWCYESEHVETKKCPLHVACAKGHLPILRLFIKNSPLCFITKDEQGRIPIQIVLRHRHRACFEFIIARQWGRKSGKDFTFSITLYCRILQWCERAKVRTMLMLGVNKSTFKGFPQKTGALVGTSVIVDGFSKKPANSVPYSLIPKPNIPPEKMISAIALTKRRFKTFKRRQSSSKLVSRRNSSISMQSGRRLNRLTSADTNNSVTSYASFDKSQSSLDVFLEQNHLYERDLLNDGNIRAFSRSHKNFNSITNASSTLLKRRGNDTFSKKTEKDSNNATVEHEIDRFNLPSLSSSSGLKSKVVGRKDSKISFTPSVLNTNVVQDKNDFRLRSLEMSHSSISQPSPAVKRLPVDIMPSPNVLETGIPLPPKSVESKLKPFFYWSPYESVENPVRETLQRFETHRGVPARKHAVQCLSVTSSFTEKTWLQQLRMAVCLTKREVKKSTTLQSSAVIS